MARPAKLPVLGELEASVLEHLWKCDNDDVNGCHHQIGIERGISPNTVGSALERLFKKGLVTREKVSHAYRYEPALSREAFAAQRIVEAAGSKGSLGQTGLLSAFVDLVADEDEALLDRLELLIEARRKAK